MTVIAKFFKDTPKIRNLFQKKWEEENKIQVKKLNLALYISDIFYNLIRASRHYNYKTKSIIWNMLKNDIRLERAIQEDLVNDWDHICNKEHAWYKRPWPKRPRQNYLKDKYLQKRDPKRKNSIAEALRRFFIDNGTLDEKLAQTKLVEIWIQEKNLEPQGKILQTIRTRVIYSDIEMEDDEWSRSRIDMDIFLRKYERNFLNFSWILFKDHPEWEMAVYRDSFRNINEDHPYQEQKYKIGSNKKRSVS